MNAKLIKLKRHSFRYRLGVSILEVVISAAILGGVGVVAMNGIASTYQSQLDTSDLARADLLARELMDEITQQDFERGQEISLVPFGDSTRTRFTYLDQYDGWNSDSSKPPQSKDGTLLDVGSGWSRLVTIENVSLDNLTEPVNTNTGVKKIQVAVGRDGDKIVVKTAYRSKYEGALSISRD